MIMANGPYFIKTINDKCIFMWRVLFFSVFLSYFGALQAQGQTLIKTSVAEYAFNIRSGRPFTFLSLALPFLDSAEAISLISKIELKNSKELYYFSNYELRFLEVTGTSFQHASITKKLLKYLEDVHESFLINRQKDTIRPSVNRMQQDIFPGDRGVNPQNNVEVNKQLMPILAFQKLSQDEKNFIGDEFAFWAKQDSIMNMKVTKGNILKNIPRIYDTGYACCAEYNTKVLAWLTDEIDLALDNEEIKGYLNKYHEKGKDAKNFKARYKPEKGKTYTLHLQKSYNSLADLTIAEEPELDAFIRKKVAKDKKLDNVEIVYKDKEGYLTTGHSVSAVLQKADLVVLWHLVLKSEQLLEINFLPSN